MKRITITVSGSQEASLAKQIANGAARLLEANWDPGCSLKVEEVPERELCKTVTEKPYTAKTLLQVPSFMVSGSC